LLLDLVRTDRRPTSGLACYTRNMMEVMSFDADRRGRCITQAELDGYTRSLAVAVTECLHYFIGQGRGGPDTPDRYLAVIAAHISHMLRDTREDVDAGYYNIPLEVLSAAGISPGEVESPAYRAYVRQRVGRARLDFERGKAYFAQVGSRRCRLAAFIYCSRFEAFLDALERNNYDLTSDLPRPSLLSSGRSWAALAAALPSPPAGDGAERLATLEPPPSAETGFRRSKCSP
jgi:phytoene/squalene synthetase